MSAPRRPYAHSHLKPTPLERELLIHLIEEAAEIQQRATKLLRFGATEVQEGQKLTNVERLSMEIGNLTEICFRLGDVGIIDWNQIEAGKNEKAEKLRHYLSPEAKVEWEERL